MHRRRKRGTGRRDHPGTTRSLWRTSGESFSSAAYLGKGSFYMPTALFLPPSLPSLPLRLSLSLGRRPPALALPFIWRPMAAATAAAWTNRRSRNGASCSVAPPPMTRRTGPPRRPGPGGRAAR